MEKVSVFKKESSELIVTYFLINVFAMTFLFDEKA